MGRKLQAGKDVFALEIGEVRQDLFHVDTLPHQFEDIADPNAHAANARLVAGFPGFDGNAIKQAGIH